jgi:UPF0176 protein
LSDADKQSPLFQAGVSCPRCHASLTPEQRRSFAERQRQIELAQSRQQRHIGVPRGRTPSPAHDAAPAAEGAADRRDS